MLDNYKKLFLKRRIAPNLLTLEIVEKLYNKPPQEVPYGITELYESMLHPKPTFSSFRAQVLALESAGCIEIKKSTEKASKKSVTLNKDFRSQVETNVYG